jgi:uncharacterized membrane protein YfcA
MELGLDTLALLCATAFAAGFVDAIAGGGGLLTIPALLLAGVPPVAAVATNKVQGTLSILSALFTYGRSGIVEWRAGLPMAAMSFAVGIIGALSVHILPKEAIAALIPALLIAVALYFGLVRGMGDADRKSRLTRMTFILLVVPPIAFYDGFLGPGAGSFYALALIALQGFGITRTTAMSKLLNGGSNAGSLLLFSIAGSVLWPLGLGMGVCSMLGAQVGSRLAIKQGARIIRPLIVLTCCALSIKMLADPTNPVHVYLVNLHFPS